MTTHAGPEEHSDTHRLTSAEFEALFKQLRDATARGPEDRDIRLADTLLVRHEHRVEVRAEGADWVVTIDEHVQRVSMARTGAGWSLLVGDVRSGDAGSRRSYDVRVQRVSPAAVTVHVDGVAVPVSLPEGRASTSRRARAGGRSGESQVVAPMPGRVVSVLVEPGDDVVERQAVVVLEAMKMQNEVRAARSGVVAEVRVASGAAVEAGAVLVVIGEPRASGGS